MEYRNIWKTRYLAEKCTREQLERYSMMYGFDPDTIIAMDITTWNDENDDAYMNIEFLEKPKKEER